MQCLTRSVTERAALLRLAAINVPVHRGELRAASAEYSPPAKPSRELCWVPRPTRRRHRYYVSVRHSKLQWGVLQSFKLRFCNLFIALRTNPMSEGSFGVIPHIGLQLLPVIAIVADALAIGADG